MSQCLPEELRKFADNLSEDVLSTYSTRDVRFFFNIVLPYAPWASHHIIYITSGRMVLTFRRGTLSSSSFITCRTFIQLLYPECGLFLPKRLCIFIRLHDVTYQMIVIVIVTTVSPKFRYACYGHNVLNPAHRT
jgi:hypothetical protein